MGTARGSSESQVPTTILLRLLRTRPRSRSRDSILSRKIAPPSGCALRARHAGGRPCEQTGCEEMRCEKTRCEEMRCEETRCEETRCEDARCEEVRCEEMKCEEVNCVVATTHLGHTPRGAPGVGWGTSGGPGGVPRRKVLAFGSKGGKSTSNRCKEDAIRMKSAKFGRNRRKSKKFRSFITEKAIFCGQTDRRRHFSAQSWGTSFLGPPE